MHAEWARSIEAEFISDTLTSVLKIPNLSRLLKSGTVIKKIPKSTDLLLCESGAEIVAGALWKRQNPNKKLVLIVSDTKLFYLSQMNFVKRRLYYWALSYYDLFIPTSPYMKEFIPAPLREKSEIVAPYFDIKHYSFEKIDLENKNIIFVGRVGKEKGIDLIIRTFKIVEKSFPNSKLYIIGEGPLIKRLQDDKDKNIIWTGWEDDPRKYLLKGTIYLNLARIEPAGVAILEAMCMGLVPIITNNVGFNYVVKRVCEDLVVSNSEKAADVIVRLWRSPELYKKYSDECRQISTDFTKEKSVEKFRNTIMKMNSEPGI